MTKMKKENLIKSSKRIVIKIGSSLLIDKNEGSLKSVWLRSLAQEVDQLIQQKKYTQAQDIALRIIKT